VSAIRWKKPGPPVSASMSVKIPVSGGPVNALPHGICAT
jgi:hypothetical protein